MRTKIQSDKNKENTGWYNTSTEKTTYSNVYTSRVKT